MSTTISIKEYLKSHPNVKYILFGGKGGLGKTTLSAATSYWLAKSGKKVVVFSTDPQASLTDIFERNIFGKGEVEIAPNLFALEIDADKRIADYQQEIRKKIESMYGEVPKEVDDYIQSAAAEPAMAESATFDAMVELMTSGNYDYYIFDMMPHGHAIRFLGMSEILDAWVNKIVETRKKAAEYGDVASVLSGKGGLAQEDRILEELEFIRSRLGFVSDMMRDEEHTAFFYVLIPELMPILDTRKALEMFRAFNIPLSGVIVNQVYPADLLKQKNVPAFLKNKISMQQKHLKAIQEEFGPLIRGIVPMFDREPKGLKMIAEVSKVLFEEERYDEYELH
ncbi:MAG: TRC40/GET3/ArsA family transport-energizing ATPase [Candidatus Bathyarchaeia archaeon]